MNNFLAFILKTLIGVGFVMSGRYFQDPSVLTLMAIYLVGFLLMEVWADMRNKSL